MAATKITYTGVDGITVDASGNVALPAGSITLAAGSLTLTAGSVNAPAGSVTVSSLVLGTWTISDSGGKLIFDNGTTQMSLSATGALITVGDQTAIGTP